MSIIGFIVIGDRTSHGGIVVTGDPTCTIDGQPVARVGDKVWCPRCGRATTIATSRFPTVIDLGKPMAYDQDMTDCGAILYSRHNGHSGWGNDDGDTVNTVPPIEEPMPKLAPRFQEHFVLHNNETGAPLPGIPYTVKTGDGTTIQGTTDAQGRTGIVWTDSPLPVELIAHPKMDENADPYHFDDDIDYSGL
jgi:uncharacterized Zn-binding protein involved in type VI secretion